MFTTFASICWLHISQDALHFARRNFWQSWSKNYSKYELVQRIYTIYYGGTGCSRSSWPICLQQIAIAFGIVAGYTAIATLSSAEVLRIPLNSFSFP